MQSTTYEVRDDRLRVRGESFMGQNFQSSFELAQLSSDPYRVWTRSDAIRQVWSVAILLVTFGPVLYLGLMGEKVAELEPVRYIWYWIAALAICVAGWLFAPRTEHVIFRFKSGEPAVDIVRSGSRSNHAFDEFVAALQQRAGSAVQ